MITLSKNHNPNYVATLISLPAPRKHSNADKLQCVSINGCNVITGLNAREGDLYVYFPVESVINYSFLSYTDSFKDKTKNTNQEKVGFFEDSGRVKALRLRGEKSEGYIVPWNNVADWINESFHLPVNPPAPGTDFDTINGELFCWKYIVPVRTQSQGTSVSGKKNKKHKVESRIIPEQFHFHVDTENLRKHITRLNQPYPIIVTRKLHGTSAVFSNVLVKRKLSLIERVLKWFGVKIVSEEYDFIYSSRSEIKNDTPKEHNHFYKEDIWGAASHEFRGKIEPGITLYGEIVGFTPGGGAIQKGYDYGCAPKTHKTYIYRITLTNPNGDVFEFSWDQIANYCIKKGFTHVPVLDSHIHEHTLESFSEIYLEQDCWDCATKVPDEGICVRVEVPNKYEVYKLKSFKFLERETKALDAGEADIEVTQ